MVQKIWYIVLNIWLVEKLGKAFQIID